MRSEPVGRHRTRRRKVADDEAFQLMLAFVRAAAYDEAGAMKEARS
jgi:hypothetical protein